MEGPKALAMALGLTNRTIIPLYVHCKNCAVLFFSQYTVNISPGWRCVWVSHHSCSSSYCSCKGISSPSGHSKICAVLLFVQEYSVILSMIKVSSGVQFSLASSMGLAWATPPFCSFQDLWIPTCHPGIQCNFTTVAGVHCPHWRLGCCWCII